jgi:hypothetical protein
MDIDNIKHLFYKFNTNNNNDIYYIEKEGRICYFKYTKKNYQKYCEDKKAWINFLNDNICIFEVPVIMALKRLRYCNILLIATVVIFFGFLSMTTSKGRPASMLWFDIPIILILLSPFLFEGIKGQNFGKIIYKIIINKNEDIYVIFFNGTSRRYGIADIKKFSLDIEKTGQYIHFKDGIKLRNAEQLSYSPVFFKKINDLTRKMRHGMTQG